MKGKTLITMLLVTTQVVVQMASLPKSGWTAEKKLTLAGSASGRIVLHLICACHDHHFQWHWRGVARELVRR